MAAVKLTKGQKVSLTKPGDGLDKIMCGYKWEKSFGLSCDVDGSAICLDKYGNIIGTVCYSKLNFKGYIHHHGDNLTGYGKRNSDKEQIDICLRAMTHDVERVVIIMNIYDAYHKDQDLTGISNCSIHIQNVKNGQDLVEFDISQADKKQYKGKTGFYVGTFLRDGVEWKFEAIGEAIRVRNIREMEEIASDYYSSKSRNETFAEYIQNHENNKRSIGKIIKSIFS